MSAREWNEEQAAGERSLRKSNVNPHERAYMALRIIRTWAAFDLEHPEYKRTLDPAHVLKLCDEAIEASKKGGA